MEFLAEKGSIETMKKYTDKHRDNIPALLSSMWYCGSICAAFMWRYMIPSLTPPSGRFMTCQKYTQKRLILLTYFWAIEAFLGILALRSLNYVNEEARDKVTPKSALIKMQVFSLLRDVGANAFFRVISTPWERERKFHFYFGISFIFTALFGKYFSYFCLIEAFLTIRSMSNNTKAYQGQEDIGLTTRCCYISFAIYTLGFILNDAQLNIGFCLTAWCVFKFYMACFTQLQEYYWLKHFHHDHHLQRKFINFIYRTPTEPKN